MPAFIASMPMQNSTGQWLAPTQGHQDQRTAPTLRVFQHAPSSALQRHSSSAHPVHQGPHPGHYPDAMYSSHPQAPPMGALYRALPPYPPNSHHDAGYSQNHGPVAHALPNHGAHSGVSPVSHPTLHPPHPITGPSPSNPQKQAKRGPKAKVATPKVDYPPYALVPPAYAWRQAVNDWKFVDMSRGLGVALGDWSGQHDDFYRYVNTPEGQIFSQRGRVSRVYWDE